jgi:hypothetical protein
VTIVVLLFLAGLWAVVLVPPYLRNRSENRPADSISSFRRQLSVLERTTPGTMAPASRIGPYRPPHGASGSLGSVVAPTPVMSLRQAQKRRRDILSGLVAVLVGSLLLSLVPTFRPMLLVAIGTAVLLAVYVAVLVQGRRAAEERELKVHYLQPHGAPEPALLLRRSAN